MNATAPMLPFSARPINAEDDAAALMLELRTYGRWVRRSELQKGVFWLWPERRFRAAASASKGQIIGGSKGYCLTVLASVQDVEHAERQLHSQARAMLRRVIQIRRARNSG